jgi:hypothetical protein
LLGKTVPRKKIIHILLAYPQMELFHWLGKTVPRKILIHILLACPQMEFFDGDMLIKYE